MAGIVRLTVNQYNKKVLTTARAQVFDCSQMDKVVDTTGGGSDFFYPRSASIPGKYHVAQTTAQIRAMCNACCDSNSE